MSTDSMHSLFGGIGKNTSSLRPSVVIRGTSTVRQQTDKDLTSKSQNISLYKVT